MKNHARDSIRHAMSIMKTTLITNVVTFWQKGCATYAMKVLEECLKNPQFLLTELR